MNAVDTNILIYRHDTRDPLKQDTEGIGAPCTIDSLALVNPFVGP